MTRKALILARVSTEIQSLESQIEKLKDEAKHLGYSDYTIISGKESGVKLDIEERHTIQQLKQHIETGEYGMVIIWEVSRLARKPKVLYEVRDYLIEKHVNLHCMTPNFTMLNDNGEIDPTASIVFAIFGTMAEEEARLSKERMSRGKKHKQSLGGYIGGKPLFGYTFENDILTIDYSKIDIIKKIYNLYEAGYSTTSIANELMQTGELKQDNLNNANKQVQTVVSRPEYYGGVSKQTGYKYPAIITKTQFDKCRKIAKDKTKEHKRVKKTCLCKKMIWFNGHLLTPNVAKGQYKLYTIDHSMNASMNIDRIDEIVWNIVVKNMNEDEIDRSQIEMEANVALRKVQQAHRNITELLNQIDRIENRIIEGKMSEIKGDKMIEQKKLEIEEQQSILDTNNYIYGQKNEMLHEESYKIDIEKLSDEEKQILVRKYVDRIELEKMGLRGRYLITIKLKNGQNYKYEYYSSGPWHNYKLI